MLTSSEYHCWNRIRSINFMMMLVMSGLLSLMVACQGAQEKSPRWIVLTAPEVQGTIQAAEAVLATFNTFNPDLQVGLVINIDSQTEPLVIPPASAADGISRLRKTLESLGGQPFPAIPGAALPTHISSLGGGWAIFLAANGMGGFDTSSILPNIARGGTKFFIVGPRGEVAQELAAASGGSVLSPGVSGGTLPSIIEAAALSAGRTFSKAAVENRVQSIIVDRGSVLGLVYPSSISVELLDDTQGTYGDPWTVGDQHLVLITPGEYTMVSESTTAVTMIALGPGPSPDARILDGILNRWTVIAVAVLAGFVAISLVRNRGRGSRRPNEGTARGQYALLEIGDSRVTVDDLGLTIGSGAPPIDGPFVSMPLPADDHIPDMVFANMAVEKQGLAYFPEIPYQLNGVDMASLQEIGLSVLDTISWDQWPELRLTVIHVSEV